MKSPSVRSILPAAILLALIGWVGLIYLIIFTLPTLGPRWLFFCFGVMAITGLALPIVTFLNIRFPTDPPASRKIIVREASMAGVCFAMLAWFQLGRTLTLPLGLILAAGFALVEGLIRMREKSRWNPD